MKYEPLILSYEVRDYCNKDYTLIKEGVFKVLIILEKEGEPQLFLMMSDEDDAQALMYYMEDNQFTSITVHGGSNLDFLDDGRPSFSGSSKNFKSLVTEEAALCAKEIWPQHKADTSNVDPIKNVEFIRHHRLYWLDQITALFRAA